MIGRKDVCMHTFCGENMRHGHKVSVQYFVLDVTDLLYYFMLSI